MSLYDGLEFDSEKDDRDISGWSSGIKLLQSQLQLKKAALTQTKKDPFKKGVVLLPPVVDLKTKKDEPEETLSPISFVQNRENRAPNSPFAGDPEWNVRDEYDPLYPNDYEKIVKDQREKKEKEREEERRRDYEERRRRNSERYRERDDGERGRDRNRKKRNEEEEEDYERPRRSVGNSGAAIAPPPSLIEDEKDLNSNLARDRDGVGGGPGFSSSGRGGSVALKIMAKYGFREGQGLGKQEQGMSQALQVEKTSKRGGKIIHEKDIPKGNDDLETVFTPPPPPSIPSQCPTPPQAGQLGGTESITEAMKNPSKVVLLRNMVGPGEVDEELEPEVKEECSKYGEVNKCLIFEIPNTNEEEAVRIFVEFKRIESAIKAIIDLNGRYFGGRIVKAGFYNLDKFRRLDLGD